MIKTRKMWATILAAGFLSTQPALEILPSPGVYAKSPDQWNKTELQELGKDALAQLLPVVPKLKDFSIQSVSIDEDDGEEQVINIHLRKSDSEKYPYASVQIDPKTKEIVLFSIQEGVDKTDRADKELAKEKATAFLKALLGDEAKKYTPREHDIGKSGSIVFDLFVDGILFNAGSIRVGVNIHGDITSFSRNLAGQQFQDPKKFPKPDHVISQEEALSAMAKTLRLVYEEKNGWTNAPVLKYVPELDGEMNAETGVVEHSFKTSSNKYGQPFSVQPLGKKWSIRSEQDAQQVLKEVLQIGTEGLQFRQLQGSTYEWIGKEGERLFVAADEKTGGLVSVGNRGVKTEGKGRLTKEQAKRKALDTLEPYLDKSVTSLQMREMYAVSGTDRYSFFFHRSHDGIPVEDHSYEVVIDLASGTVIELTGSFDRKHVDLPDKDQAVDPETAMQEFRVAHQATLIYSAFDNDGIGDLPSLVYDFKAKTTGFSYIDALTGKSVIYTVD